MVNSMTAFARSQAHIPGFVLTWEIRSVNHRFLEPQFRLPEQLRSIEYPLRETLHKHLSRGKLDSSLRIDRQAEQSKIELNRPLLLQVLAMVEQVRRDAPEIGSPNPMDLLRWPGVIGDDARFEDKALTTAVTDLFEEALTELIAHRQREGERLAATITSRLDEIDRLVGEVKVYTTSIGHQVQAKLQARLDNLEVQVDADRLEQEVALLAQRADVAEELDRLAIHVEEARTILRAPGPHGRRLDFLTQELNREANTLGAKATLVETSQKSVDLKVIIEQIREQVQNVE
ncbi:MAG: YicC/YloC family endoribonuclease [Pseudomonadales bacterium]